jgi:nicotinamide-nucleotide amidase
MRIDDDLYALAARLGQLALAQQVLLAAAESCTGGLVAGAITAVPGSSLWFERGFVTYSDAAKVEQLNVAPATLERFGAVSVQTAAEMAAGALRASRAQWALAITGVAGPGGGTAEKPVGMVCFGWSGPGGVATEQRRLEGDRAAIRLASVRIALAGLVGRLA